MYFEVLVKFVLESILVSLYLNDAEYFLPSNDLFLRLIMLYVLYDSLVNTDLSVTIKTTTITSISVYCS